MSHKYHSIPIPRCQIQKPENFAAQVRSIHPLNNPDGWVCLEADCYVVEEPGHPDGVKQTLPAPAVCPVCLEPANRLCSQCESVYYCSRDCQKRHWRFCHKKACSPNPNLYAFNTSLDQFRGLPDEFFRGHEFMIIKPTEQLESIADICESALEDCDDIFDIRGFGTDQIDASWVPTQQHGNPVARRLCERFGWSSGSYGIERMEGYRVVEDHFVYMVLFDDCFQNSGMSPGLETSYYGAGCFALPEGKSCRGNVIIFHLQITKRSWRDIPTGSPLDLLLQMTDDDNFQFEYELQPLCKAEIAQMLHERTKALEENAFTRRTWRNHTRRIERNVELSKRTTATIGL